MTGTALGSLCRDVLAMNEFLEPGDLVRHPDEPDWGVGQVQSVIGNRITVNFQHRGKVLIDGTRIMLRKTYEAT